MIEAVNIVEKLEKIDQHWQPRIAGELNDSYIKLAKLQGEFVWHHHADEDEMFLVVRGRLLMKLRDGDVWVNEGEFIIIPRGVEHLPVAEDEVHILLLEPKTTVNTGNVREARTLDEEMWV